MRTFREVTGHVSDMFARVYADSAGCGGHCVLVSLDLENTWNMLKVDLVQIAGGFRQSSRDI